MMNYKNDDSFVEVDEEYLDQKIKEKLSLFEYREYEEEESGEYVYEFKNKNPRENLLIVIDGEATIYYADSHSHYEFYKSDIDELIQTILDIFNNELKVVNFSSLKRWLGDFWLHKAEIVDGVSFLERQKFPKEFIQELKRLGGTITETYWSEEEKVYKIEPLK